MSKGWETYTKSGIDSIKKKILLIVAAVLFVLGLTIIGIVAVMSGSKDKPSKEVEITEEELREDPQAEKEQDEENVGADVNVSEMVDENKTNETTYGIDVSKYQGNIDWKKVADSGIDFAMIRVGYRAMANGEIVEDSSAKYNMQEAQKYGVKIGAYFFSTAVSKEEAIGEANWVADYIAQYQITYPVAYNCEGFEKESSRQYSMTKEQRTDAAMAFLETIAEHGYAPMFYAAKGELENETKWETERISSIYSVWVAQYPEKPYPETSSSDYTGAFSMWQHTNQGKVPGISQPVDLNIAYFGYAFTKDAKEDGTPEQVGINVEALMNFTNVNETVTAKDKTNLRNKPSQGSDSSVLHTLTNGETVTRTGISPSGWSRVDYNGTTYYAVSNYLTTDLNYKPPTQEPDDGIKTEFTKVNEKVTPKEAVNLRKLPSVTHEDAEIVVQIKNGDVVTRTGISHEMGWSRVEYDGQILYCISSYLKLAE